MNKCQECQQCLAIGLEFDKRRKVSKEMDDIANNVSFSLEKWDKVKTRIHILVDNFYELEKSTENILKSNVKTLTDNILIELGGK
jgi:hypothetical protein